MSIYYFLSFLSEVDLQEVAKIVEKSHVPPTQTCIQTCITFIIKNEELKKILLYTQEPT